MRKWWSWYSCVVAAATTPPPRRHHAANCPPFQIHHAANCPPVQQLRPVPGVALQYSWIQIRSPSWEAILYSRNYVPMSNIDLKNWLQPSIIQGIQEIWKKPMMKNCRFSVKVLVRLQPYQNLDQESAKNWFKFDYKACSMGLSVLFNFAKFQIRRSFKKLLKPSNRSSSYSRSTISYAGAQLVLT